MKKKEIRITPVLSEKEFQLISSGLHCYAEKYYDLYYNNSTYLSNKGYTDAREEFNKATALSNKLENLFHEKLKLKLNKEKKK